MDCDVQQCNATSLRRLFVQCSNLRRGLTYIESCRHPPLTDFDFGLRKNAAAIFGESLGRRFLHLLPVPRQPIGDGVNFSRRQLVHNA
mmetsp:Transcript_40615/g.94829  ORF Transcript_40615/g.94829 Transcript_40615/m.94829 type:complete len:88 (+) Transcript_40615:133-396(+)